MRTRKRRGCQSTRHATLRAESTDDDEGEEEEDDGAEAGTRIPEAEACVVITPIPHWRAGPVQRAQMVESESHQPSAVTHGLTILRPEVWCTLLVITTFISISIRF
jgi:hypothetical protein